MDGWMDGWMTSSQLTNYACYASNGFWLLSALLTGSTVHYRTVVLCVSILSTLFLITSHYFTII